ncbi:ATP-dependent Clp protease proteolytic subunit [Pseudonocardia sp. H11422]|uniref:ATP-dependent Clp protease proteolytic subunit n=1 Tax=Pseudonocardia sp. H11422 TaxID=2835866 RepID=UPI001BDC42FE|nr:ATP-dependent Clp protease proteolytic subunit [Pseudonocardia sp. H11422]
MSTWPPFPPEPWKPRHNPWQPEPRPGTTPAAGPSLVLVEARPDRLAERMIEQRLVAVAGELDSEAANRAVATLALLDASGDEPVELRLSGVSADLDTALTLVDTLDLMGVPVHATCLGALTGPAVALVAVADQRVAGPHAVLHLCEPRPPRGIAGRDLDTYAQHYQRQLRRLQERIATACRRPVDVVAGDMRDGRLLTAEQARAYGLVDTCTARSTRRPGAPASG